MTSPRQNGKSKSGLPYFLWNLWVVLVVVWGIMLAAIGYWDWLATSQIITLNNRLVEHDVRDSAANTSTEGNVLEIPDLGTIIIAGDQATPEELAKIKNLKEETMARIGDLERRKLIYTSLVHFAAFAIPAFTLLAVGRLFIRVQQKK